MIEKEPTHVKVCGRPLSPEHDILINNSLATMQWLGGHGVQFETIYNRQTFENNGRHVFWGGLIWSL